MSGTCPAPQIRSAASSRLGMDVSWQPIRTRIVLECLKRIERGDAVCRSESGGGKVFAVVLIYGLDGKRRALTSTAVSTLHRCVERASRLLKKSPDRYPGALFEVTKRPAPFQRGDCRALGAICSAVGLELLQHAARQLHDELKRNGRVVCV